MVSVPSIAMVPLPPVLVWMVRMAPPALSVSKRKLLKAQLFALLVEPKVLSAATS